MALGSDDLRAIRAILGPHRRVQTIDPGPEESAVVGYDLKDKKPFQSLILPNSDIVRAMVRKQSVTPPIPAPSILLVEMIASYGMAVGKSVFDTCFWIGRFVQAWSGTFELIYRKDIKLELCGTARAKDANVNQRLRDIYATRFGISEKMVKGTKKCPGPLYGFKSHMWAALAIAEYWAAKHSGELQ